MWLKTELSLSVACSSTSTHFTNIFWVLGYNFYHSCMHQMNCYLYNTGFLYIGSLHNQRCYWKLKCLCWYYVTLIVHINLVQCYQYTLSSWIEFLLYMHVSNELSSVQCKTFMYWLFPQSKMWVKIELSL